MDINKTKQGGYFPMKLFLRIINNTFDDFSEKKQKLPVFKECYIYDSNNNQWTIVTKQIFNVKY